FRCQPSSTPSARPAERSHDGTARSLHRRRQRTVRCGRQTRRRPPAQVFAKIHPSLRRLGREECHHLNAKTQVNSPKTLMTHSPIRVGFIGLSPGIHWAATAHVPALEALPDDYEIVGVANTSLASARTAADAFRL